MTIAKLQAHQGTAGRSSNREMHQNAVAADSVQM
jgi:hypothetical protein